MRREPDTRSQKVTCGKRLQEDDDTPWIPGRVA